MKIFPQSSVDGFGLAVLKKGLFYGTLFLTLIIGLLLLQLEQKYKFRPAGVAAGVVFLVGLLVAFFFVPAVIEKMRQDKGMYLREAIVHTFYSYALMGAFLPVVGPLIGRVVESRKATNPFTSNDDQTGA
jgi:uncharacterized membrane protein